VVASLLNGEGILGAVPAGEGLRKAHAMTLVAGVLWGTSFVSIQWGLDDGFHPVVFVGVRFIIAFGSALAVAAFLGPLNTGLLKSGHVWGLGLTNTGGFVFQYASLGLTTATKAALITNLSLIVVAPLSYYWLGERFTWHKVVALMALVPRFTWHKVVALMALVPGVFLLTTGGDLDALGGSEFLGDMLSLAAGISWAFYIIISKRILEDPDVTVPALTLWAMGTTAAFLVPMAGITLAVGGASLSQVGQVGWAMAVYTGLFCSTVAYLFWTGGLRGLTATVSAVLLLIMIVVAAVMDFTLQGTGMGPVPMLGAAILLGAMLLVSFTSDGEVKGVKE
jgi:DME family drug/metabolite transporter